MFIYVNNKICGEMVFVFGKMFKEEIVREINQNNYISVMADGVIDVGGFENEIVFCYYVQDGYFVNRLIGYKVVEYVYVEGMY